MGEDRASSSEDDVTVLQLQKKETFFGRNIFFHMTWRYLAISGMVLACSKSRKNLQDESWGRCFSWTSFSKVEIRWFQGAFFLSRCHPFYNRLSGTELLQEGQYLPCINRVQIRNIVFIFCFYSQSVRIIQILSLSLQSRILTDKYFWVLSDGEWKQNLMSISQLTMLLALICDLLFSAGCRSPLRHLFLQPEQCVNLHLSKHGDCPRFFSCCFCSNHKLFYVK